MLKYLRRRLAVRWGLSDALSPASALTTVIMAATAAPAILSHSPSLYPSTSDGDDDAVASSTAAASPRSAQAARARRNLIPARPEAPDFRGGGRKADRADGEKGAGGRDDEPATRFCRAPTSCTAVLAATPAGSRGHADVSWAGLGEGEAEQGWRIESNSQRPEGEDTGGGNRRRQDGGRSLSVAAIAMEGKGNRDGTALLLVVEVEDCFETFVGSKLLVFACQVLVFTKARALWPGAPWR